MLLRNSWESDDEIVTRKTWSLVSLSFILILILALRLFYIQVFQYTHYLSMLDDIRIKRRVIEATRGRIFDRNGGVVAENRMSYSITFDPLEREKFAESITHLASLVPELPELLNVSRERMVEKVMNETKDSPNPEKIIQNADFRLLSIVEEHKPELPGVGGEFGQQRYYPFGSLAAHAVGYMGKLTKADYNKLRNEGYEYGSFIGKNGIEKMYEKIMKGKNGAKFLEMNYMSRILQKPTDVKPIPPVPGKNITLTLDMRLQLAVQEAYGDSLVGALVALDPRNGEVLVMASFPSFDPNEVTQMYASLVNDPDKPMFNRAIQATYPPGSTFKPITALAGLENGFTADTEFQPCDGAYYFGQWYECWDENGHGVLDLVEAIINSCNIYFYQLARKVGLEKWHEYGAILGFGKKSGIDIQGEEAGLLPGRKYYVERSDINYSLGMMLNLAIGQGENLATILQLAYYTGIIATEGVAATPRLVLSDYETPRRIIEISPESFRVVKRGMLGVVHDPHGTAKSAWIPGHRIAGKTGTAQNPHGAAHKLFIAFAPYDEPSIAVACVVENAGDYPVSLAVSIVRKLLMTYFEYYTDNRVTAND
ncbi:penicillin-binding protein 2 [Candidatus Latescibacterota bacterium]